ncbi:LysR family transcriptional regulator [Micromonospora sp. KC207]|uniref:LysR family transcriptional regulator n=1 Tax=Micromonospora sp. KC207 TaxID=2530377 RepID=UPI00352C041F
MVDDYVHREVAATGSFTAAADNLGYTQSAISRQIAATESAAGSTLFDRGRRGTGPARGNRAGRCRGRRVRTGRPARPLAGRVTVGAFPTASAALIPRALAQLRTDHPGASRRPSTRARRRPCCAGYGPAGSRWR